MAYMRTPSYGMHAKKHMNHVHLLDAPNRTVGSSAHHFKKFTRPSQLWPITPCAIDIAECVAT